MIKLVVQPVPEVSFTLQMLGAGGAVGLVVAYRAWRRGFEIDSWVITARWSMVGLVGGTLYVLWKGLG